MGTSISLKAAAAAYVVHLGATGSKPSTIGTVQRTLALLTGAMGEDKEVGKILPVHVDGFYKSEAATMLKGKPRATASILQIRRIVRAALVWWHEQGYSDRVPLPAIERTIQDKHDHAAAKRAAKAAGAETGAETPADEPGAEAPDATPTETPTEPATTTDASAAEVA
jgi:hypothetical protein